MDKEIPYFAGTLEERVRQIETWLRSQAERQAASPNDIYAMERGARRDEGDEIIVTYSDGSKRRYLLPLA